MLVKMGRSIRVAAPTAVALALAGCVSSGPATPTAGRTSGATATTGARADPSGTAALTAAPPPTTGPTASPPPAASAPSTAAACTAALGDGCGAYDYPGIPNSNGSNTYVSNQAVGPQPGTTQTVRANNPGDWQLVAHAVPHGYRGVQTFPDVQQLFNSWCGSGWGDCAKPSDTPLDSLTTLKVVYSETSPPDGKSINEFAVDAWSDGYGSDIMFWTDTHGRCDEGAFGDTLLGHAVLDGQHWTVHRYGGPGDEVIFVLDGAGGSGTCAQQPAGTVDVKAGLNWLTTHGFAKGPQTISQVNTGWEITSADDATFVMHRYAIQAVPG